MGVLWHHGHWAAMMLEAALTQKSLFFSHPRVTWMSDIGVVQCKVKCRICRNVDIYAGRMKDDYVMSIAEDIMRRHGEDHQPTIIYHHLPSFTPYHLKALLY